MLKVMSGAYFAAEDGNHVMLLRLLHLSELLHFTMLIIGFWSTQGLTIQTALYILLWLYTQFVTAVRRLTSCQNRAVYVSRRSVLGPALFIIHTFDVSGSLKMLIFVCEHMHVTRKQPHSLILVRCHECGIMSNASCDISCRPV